MEPETKMGTTQGNITWALSYDLSGEKKHVISGFHLGL